MKEFFVVRRADSSGDVALTWNYGIGDWAWDLDGEYTKFDHFAYTTRRSAQIRADQIKARDIEYKFGKERANGVRVVTREEFDNLRAT